MLRHRNRVVLTATISGALVAASAAALWWGSAGPAGAASSGTLFRDPDSQVMRWVAANPGDPRAGLIRDRIASRPQAHWFTRFNPESITAEVAGLVGRAEAADAVPQFVIYAIPNRDCGGASGGGAPDIAGYRSWVQKLARGLGPHRALVILEPDSLALQTCLSSTQVAERDSALAFAVQTIKRADPDAKVYLDAGHSAWNGAEEQARRLEAAGVKSADGFFTNVSNFRRTADEVAYGKDVLLRIGSPQLHFVVDTSRNGNGPLGSEWCDPQGRALGRAPTLDTGDAAVDAFLWVKAPGEADGCAAAAGTFSPDLAVQLARNAGTAGTEPADAPPAAPPLPPTTAPSGDRPLTTAPPATAPAGGCAVAYHVDSQWQNGFVATMTIINRGAAVNGWSLTFRFPGDQRITGAWNGQATASGQDVVVRNVGYNAVIGAGATTSFGFQATYGGANSAPTAFALNGNPCAVG